MIKKTVKKVGGVFGINEVREEINALSKENDKLSRQVACTQKTLDDLWKLTNDLFPIVWRANERIDELEKQLVHMRTLQTLQYQSLANISGGKTSDGRKRFFETINPAQGDLRIYQLGCVKMLKVLIEICEQHDLKIWLHSGTLLGAVRGQKFIPWDDDVDVAMMRDDIRKLRQILENNPKYRVALAFDYINKSRQLRFRTRDPQNPCFVDIFINDYSNETDVKKADLEWKRTKQAITEKFEQTKSPLMQVWKDKVIIEETDDGGTELNELFAKYYDNKVIVEACDAKSVAWGLDNFETIGPKLFDKQIIFPTVFLDFEGVKCPVPHDYMRFLTSLFGDIWEVPNDLGLHFQHVDLRKQNFQVIRQFVGEE